MTPLRVAYLISEYPAVSHTFIRREIDALGRRGLSVMRIAMRGWNASVVDESDRCEREHTRYVLRGGAFALAAAVFRAAWSRPRKLAAASRLAWQMSRGSDRPLPVHLAYVAEACLIREWLAHEGVSHLHAHFAHNPAEVAMLTAALGGPPYSFTAHGSDIMNRPAQIGLPQTVGRAAFVVAVSSFGRSQIWRWIPHQLWTRVVIVRCGLERNYGELQAARLASESTRLICIGRLSAEKGQLLLVEAAGLLAEAGESIDISLVGDGPMRAAIEALIARHGLGDRVTITGWLDGKGIQAQLSEARALVVPSLSEGLPVVIMEAMAMGRPVIAPFLAGIPELVCDCKTGWLFPSGDAAALARAIRACLVTPHAALKSMAESAKAAVFEKHDVDREAALLAALFAKSTTLAEP